MQEINIEIEALGNPATEYRATAWAGPRIVKSGVGSTEEKARAALLANLQPDAEHRAAIAACGGGVDLDHVGRLLHRLRRIGQFAGEDGDISADRTKRYDAEAQDIKDEIFGLVGAGAHK